MGLLLLYLVVLMRLLHNAQTAPDRAGALIVMGIIAVLSFHILVNVGMVVGFMPVTGIPLPLMSYGGSSLLFTFLALGIVMNIRMPRFVNLNGGSSGRSPPSGDIVPPRFQISSTSRKQGNDGR